MGWDGQPLSMDSRWFEPHLAYTWAKMGMSICAMGMAAELRSHGIGVNTLWPLTTIATAAVSVRLVSLPSAPTLFAHFLGGTCDGRTCWVVTK
jgi:NAD(P)-dependent dehydrogenase (short-subunit alcohol dehydrogenase family)